mgnify:CR=1
MTKIIAYVHDHSIYDIAKTFCEIMEPVLIFAVCLGTAPALIWLAQMSY